MTYLVLTPEADILIEVARLQSIQKRNPPHTEAWLNADYGLAPLFAEMARRQSEAEDAPEGRREITDGDEFQALWTLNGFKESA